MNNIRFDIDAAGIGLATIDMPGRPFNVFSDALIDELEQLIDHIGRDTALTGVVFASGKDAFMAGADLAMVRGFTTLRRHAEPAVVRRTFSRLSYTLRRLERVPVPTVAAVNGLALGGGLELAMACHHRVAARGAVPCLGLPEILLGLMPGAGGTQRLPRLTSPAFAARMLLSGQAVTPAVAHEAGLIDHLAEPAQLLDSARAVARRARAGARWDHADWHAPLDAEGVLAGADAEERLCALGWVDSRVMHLYPAFAALARCLLDGYGMPMDDAIEVEVDNFLPLMLDPVAGNMVRTSFLSKTAAPKRAARQLGESDVAVRRIAVVGGGVLPERVTGRFDCVEDPSDADVVFQLDASMKTHTGADFAIGLRALPHGSKTGCAVELRYVGSFDDCEAVEIAAPPGAMAARALAATNRLRLVPVTVAPGEPGPLARLLAVVQTWSMAHADEATTRGRLADALDLRRLFTAAELAVAQVDRWGAADRALGLELLLAVAHEAAACLREGLLATPEDADVLAVIGLGYPAWSGGPLSLLDMFGRGELASADGAWDLPTAPFYAD